MLSKQHRRSLFLIGRISMLPFPSCRRYSCFGLGLLKYNYNCPVFSRHVRTCRLKTLGENNDSCARASWFCFMLVALKCSSSVVSVLRPSAPRDWLRGPRQTWPWSWNLNPYLRQYRLREGLTHSARNIRTFYTILILQLPTWLRF
jgi:hypothetical protein